MRQDLFESYILQYERAGRNAGPRIKELRKFLEFISTEHFDQFDYKTVQSWLRIREKSMGERALATAQNYIADFASWAVLFDKSIGKIPKYGKIRVSRRKPIILDEGQIVSIMRRQKSQKSARNINPRSSAVITGLLYGTGMRIGEGVRMLIGDVDFDERTIYVPSGKGERDRIVPISPSTVDVLQEYLAWRLSTRPNGDNFFIFDKADLKIPEAPYRKTFMQAAVEMGLRDPNSKGVVRTNLRVHDLRHSFAVNALIEVYKSDVDANDAIAQLSSILGHEDVRDTYWYIEAVPELVSAAFMRASS